MTTNLWLDPGFGASGDMMLGVLVGLGAPVDNIVDGLNELPVDGWTIAESTVQRCSLSATRVEVSADKSHHHRTWTSIDNMLGTAPLPEQVIVGARRTFRALGQVEADIHGVSIDDVHFHEVGAIDAIVDIVGSWLAFDLLSIAEVSCGPVGLGHGTVQAAHGQLPLPAPATAALLRGAMIRSVDASAETVTPTGAALLTTMSTRFGPMPTGVLQASARGAGGRNPDRYPNVVSGYLIGASEEPTTDTDAIQISDVLLLQTNLDDVTGEAVAHAISRCLEMGADDAWAHPIVMKKGRPGVELNVLASPTVIDRLRHVVFSETASLGLRISPVTKHAQPRTFASVNIDGHHIQIKVGPFGAKPEFDDLAAAAEALDRPLLGLSGEALRLFYSQSSDPETRNFGSHQPDS